MVLTRAQHFVGFEESTFSLFLREWRYLHRLPRASSALVAAAVADVTGQVCPFPSDLFAVFHQISRGVRQLRVKVRARARVIVGTRVGVQV